MNEIKVFTDGGARGNPGPAAIGVYILNEEGEVLLKTGRQIGVATNNIAEYQAVLEALNWLKINCQKSENNICFFIDSSLVVNQLNGLFKIKNLELKKLVLEIKKIEKEIKNKINYSHIPREKNKIADYLVNASF